MEAVIIWEGSHLDIVASNAAYVRSRTALTYCKQKDINKQRNKFNVASIVATNAHDG
jgi:hypothetical protein